MVLIIYLDKNAYVWVAKEINRMNKRSVQKFCLPLTLKNAKTIIDLLFLGQCCQEVGLFRNFRKEIKENHRE